jgi:hypothetical protein
VRVLKRSWPAVSLQNARHRHTCSEVSDNFKTVLLQLLLSCLYWGVRALQNPSAPTKIKVAAGVAAAAVTYQTASLMRLPSTSRYLTLKSTPARSSSERSTGRTHTNSRNHCVSHDSVQTGSLSAREPGALMFPYNCLIKIQV